MSVSDILTFLVTVLLAGILGLGAMELVMWMIAQARERKGSMIMALGSLFTGKRENAFRVGIVIHCCSAVIFATAYSLVMMSIGYTAMPISMVLGMAIGFFHGMIVSLMLVWVVSDRHPLEEFKGADLVIGLSHLLGHVAYGAVVGIVVGIAPV